MDKATFERGLEIRKAVLGTEYVENSFKTSDDFNRPMQELATNIVGAMSGAATACRVRRAACSTWR
jgi:hypothetical protein